jgi:hypothetical protein
MGLTRWFRWLRGERVAPAGQDGHAPAVVSCLGEPPVDMERFNQMLVENTPFGMERKDLPPAAKALLERAVMPYTVTRSGRYTQPRSYGVYELGEPSAGTARYHFGNHVVRLRELQHTHGRANLFALFLDREDAEELCRILNS